MKIVNTLFFIFFILGIVPARADINSGLVAWWQFDEGQGYEAEDSSGNGHNIWLDSPTWVVPGKIGNAFNMNGNSNVVTSTSVDLSTTNQVTVSLWAQFGVGFTLGYSGNANVFQFVSSGGNCGSNYVMLSAALQSCYGWPASNLNAWHHYVAIFNNAGGNILYIDGALQSNPTNSSGGYGRGTGNFTKRPFSLFGNAGEVDDVRIYNRALSASEVQQLYDLGNAANPLDSNTPVVSLTTPAPGATVSGTGVLLSATASSNTGMSGVQFLVDGSYVGSEVMSAPYSYSLDTTTLANGNHILAAQAHDINGNVTHSAPITVTVSNASAAMPTTSVQWPTVKNMVTDFGAKGDAERLTANTTQGSKIITIDADHALSSADVGKVVLLFQVGASTPAITIGSVTINPSYQDLITTISSVTDAHTAVLAIAPGRTMTAARCNMGTNNASAFQAAVNSVDNVHGVLFWVPAGQYLMVPTQMLTPNFYMPNNSSVVPAVVITKAGIKFVGEDVNRTILLGNGAWELEGQENCVWTGGYPATGCVERGTMFMTEGPSANVDVASSLSLEFWNLTFDGGVVQGMRHSAYNYFPADTTDGDGWDPTHSAWIDDSSALLQRLKVFNGCVFTHWRGEIVKSVSGGGCTDYTNNTTTPANCQFNDVENSSFIDGDASGLNLTFSHTYNNNVFDNLDLGEEFYQGYGNQVGSNTASTFTNNVLTNIKANGLSLSGALPTNEIESYRIENNIFDVNNAGIYYSPSARLTVRNNRFLGGSDAMSTNGAGYQPSSGGDTDHDILIEGNDVEDVSYPFDFSGLYNDLITGLTFRHNMVKYAAGSMGGSYTLSYDIFSDNYSGGAGFGSNTSLAAPYQPEVINDDGSSDYAPAIQYDESNGTAAPQTISYKSGGAWHTISWTTPPVSPATVSPTVWVLDDTAPATLPTYGPNPITPDPSSGPTTFPANPAYPGSTSAPAHVVMNILNSTAWGSHTPINLYLSSTITGHTPITLSAGKEIQVAWNGSQWTLAAGPETPPTVSLTSPINGTSSTAPANITLSATAAVATGDTVAKVEFFVNTYLVGTATTAPFTFNWNNVAYNSFVEENGTTVNNVTPATYLIYAKVTDNTGLVAYSSPVSITVNPPTYSLTVNQSSGQSGTGIVTSTPAGINCGNTCAVVFNTATSVTLIATPASGSSFAGWSGSGCSGLGTCIVTMNSNQTVTANFVTSSTTSILGDVTGTGQVTIYDAELTAQYAIGLPVANFNATAAEVDGTGKVNIYDAFLIAEYAVGVINKFPVQG